jgi:hypothetical protein
MVRRRMWVSGERSDEVNVELVTRIEAGNVLTFPLPSTNQCQPQGTVAHQPHLESCMTWA